MGFITDFKAFAVKGNVVELAVAVVLGAAFGKIITAFTDSLLMPLISLVLGKSGVAALAFRLGNTVFPVGVLLQAVIDFVLVALVLFLIIKGINSLKKEKETAAQTPAEPVYTLSEKLLIEIRDSLKK